MALGSTQPLTEMSTRNLPVGKVRPERKADLTVIFEPAVQKSWKPRRLTILWVSTACYRDSFTFFLQTFIIKLENCLELKGINNTLYTIGTSLCSSKLKPRCYYDRNCHYKRLQKTVCSSLLSSTSSMGRPGELSDFERGLVIGCHISKKSVRNIVTLLKLPKSTVGDVIVKWKREGTTSTKPRMGRPRLLTDRDRRALKKVVHETCQTSSETITREFRSATNCPASTMTVRRELRRMGFHGWAAAHKPNISSVNAKRRLKWCKERRHWTVDNWKRVIWSDVSRYTMWWPDGSFWVRRLPGER
jgi:transposase